MANDERAPMTPREYVEAIVLPTLHEALEARDDKRRAYLACLVVWHCIDALGLAEASAAPGFSALQGRPRKKAVDDAIEAAKTAIAGRCDSAFAAVQGIANGLKHPARLPLLTGTEERVPAFALDTPGAGFDEGRWDVSGLALHVGDEVVFLDTCAQLVLAALVCRYPVHLSAIALSFLDRGLAVPGLDMEAHWLIGIRSWAAGRSEVAEVWLFGSRAKDMARPESDVDLGLVLVPGNPGHDWPLGNWFALYAAWRVELEAIVGRHVSLEAFSRPGEPPSEDEAAARVAAVKLWSRELPSPAPGVW